jgi:hypothetical protein
VCSHSLRLLMYGRSEVRCCARVVIMSSDEVRVVVSGDAPGSRLEGRKGRRLFLRTCQAWRLPAFAPLHLRQAEAHADHIQDSTYLHHMIAFTIQYCTDCTHEWHMDTTVES